MPIRNRQAHAERLTRELRAAVQAGEQQIAQRDSAIAGGTCVLPVFIARDDPGLVPVLTEAVRLQCFFFMHIYEDNRKSAHVRAAAEFISAEIQADMKIFERV